MSATRLAVIGATVLATAAGCGQPHDDDVTSAASSFYRAQRAGDGRTACHLLAPKTRTELEQSAGESCARAVVGEDLPKVDVPTEVQVFGTQAEVRWRGETTFLARFDSGWKVMAAACTPQPGQPYDCTISGG